MKIEIDKKKQKIREVFKTIRRFSNDISLELFSPIILFYPFLIKKEVSFDGKN